MARLTERDEVDLTWFVREAHAAVAGLQGQRYEREGGTSSSDPERIEERHLLAAKRYRRLEAVRTRVLEMKGGVRAWGVLAVAYGVPRRDDPLPVHEDGLLVRQGLPKDIAPLARLTAAAHERGALLQAAGELAADRHSHLDSPAAYAAEAVRRALPAPGKKKGKPEDEAFLVQVRVEARQMLDDAAELWVTARREIAAEGRPKPAPIEDEDAQRISQLDILIARMRASETPPAPIAADPSAA